MLKDGTTLQQLITTEAYRRRKLSVARCIFRQIVDAVDYMDLSLLAHNDLRLDNILVTDQGEVSRHVKGERHMHS